MDFLCRPRSRRESQERTRARLIEVGREHFLRYGLGGAVAEKIAEEAGYSRGALYANFDGKEELFLAVIRATVDAELEKVRRIVREPASPVDRFRKMREGFADLVTRSEWIGLETEFQANALRNPVMREAYDASLRGRIEAGAALIEEMEELPDMKLPFSPKQMALLIGALASGLCVRSRLLKGLEAEELRRLAEESFDRLFGKGS